jgi:hypothetical protein
LSLCDQYTGRAKALCNRYCYAQDCYSPDISVVPSAVCNRAYADFVALTGEEPGCVKPCPCFDASTFANEPFYCESFAEGSLFLSNNPNVDELGTVYAFALTVDFRRCDLGVDTVGNGNFEDYEVTFAALSQTQADTCLSILLASGCQPFEQE